MQAPVSFIRGKMALRNGQKGDSPDVRPPREISLRKVTGF